MKVSDMVKYKTGADLKRTGIIVAKLFSDGILAHGVSVLWDSGELVERVPPRILEVISESRRLSPTHHWQRVS